MKEMPAVEVAKYGDRIPVTLSELKDVDVQIAALCNAHGDGGVFVDGKSVAQLKAEQAAAQEVETESPPALAGSDRHDAEIDINGHMIGLGEIVYRAFERERVNVNVAGKPFTAVEWNELGDADRELLIDIEIDEMRKAGATPEGGTQ